MAEDSNDRLAAQAQGGCSGLRDMPLASSIYGLVR